MKSIKSIFCILTVGVFATFLSSCKEDNFDSYMPTFSGFSFEKEGKSVDRNNLIIGDSITAIAVQARLGKLLNCTTHTWTVTCGTKEYAY